MSLLLGGGSVKLKTDTFENGQPTGLRVADFFGFIVTNPIPEPEPLPNNVSGLILNPQYFKFNLNFDVSDITIPNINFKNVSLYGAKSEIQLQQLVRQIKLKQDFIFFIVTEPIVPPSPGPNNVSYIQFQKVPAYGITTEKNLKKITRNIKFGRSSAQTIKKLGTIKAFGSSGLLPIEMKIWDGQEWTTVDFRVWNGSSWN